MAHVAGEKIASVVLNHEDRRTQQAVVLSHDDRRPVTVQESQRRSVAESRRAKHR